jgi:hypothetical protein
MPNNTGGGTTVIGRYYNTYNEAEDSVSHACPQDTPLCGGFEVELQEVLHVYHLKAVLSRHLNPKTSTALSEYLNQLVSVHSTYGFGIFACP